MSEVFNRGDCLADGIALLPIDRSIAAAVVEAILGSRRSVKVEQDLEVRVSGPANSLIQDIQLSLDVGLTIQRRNGPVADWNSNMVKAIVANLSEVVFGDPGVPVVLEGRRGSVLAEGLSVSVLVDDCVTCGPFLKDGGCDPWLEDEPAAQVDATDLVVLVVEGYITLAQATVGRLLRLLE